jgi:hypothetical protein
VGKLFLIFVAFNVYVDHVFVCGCVGSLLTNWSFGCRGEGGHGARPPGVGSGCGHARTLGCQQ